MVRRVAAVSLIVGSVLLSLHAMSMTLVTWALVLPSDASFDVGDRASIEQAIILAADGAREDLRAEYSLPIFMLSGALVAVSVVLACRLIKRDPLANRPGSATIPPN